MFEIIVTAEDVARPKPAPDVYVRACQALGVAPEDSVDFEDSETGVRAAAAAGLTVVAVPDMAGLALEGAHHVLGSLAEVAG
jgi:HAD superfamily hydrolase (TIGR01509 family)